MGIVQKRNIGGEVMVFDMKYSGQSVPLDI